jgi:hypothetical protein
MVDGENKNESEDMINRYRLLFDSFQVVGRKIVTLIPKNQVITAVDLEKQQISETTRGALILLLMNLTDEEFEKYVDGRVIEEGHNNG